VPVEILCALVIARFGAPARLRVWHNAVPDGACLNPSPPVLPHASARDALTWAQLYVSAVLGWPSQSTVQWSVAHAVNPNFQIPPLRGPSLFGAFSVAFLRSIAVEAQESVKPAAQEMATLIADTRIDCTAISAAFNPRSGSFQSVGNIEMKLTELTALGPQTCKLCVVAEAQPIPLEPVAETRHYEIYRLLNGLDSLPVVRALDPLDAVKRIFTLQAVSGLIC
jgi:hypothetical protein